MVQTDASSCGILCCNYVLSRVRTNKRPDAFAWDRDVSGVSLRAIRDYLSQHNFHCRPVEIARDAFFSNEHCPAILHWDNNHFIVLKKVQASPFSRSPRFHIYDPAAGDYILDERSFFDHVINPTTSKGAGLLPSDSLPTPTLQDHFMSVHKRLMEHVERLRALQRVIQQFRASKYLVGLTAALLAVSAILQFAVPYLNKRLVDDALSTRQLDLVVIIIWAQAFALLGRMCAETARGFIVVKISLSKTRIMSAHYLDRLMRSTITYFQSKSTGDIHQYMNDPRKIDAVTSAFLTQVLVPVLFLSTASVSLFFLYRPAFYVMVSALLTLVVTLLFFMRVRGRTERAGQYLDAGAHSLIAMVGAAIEDLKIFDLYSYVSQKWIDIQQKVFKTRVKLFRLQSVQDFLVLSLTEIVNLTVLFLMCRAYVHGNTSIGVILSSQYLLAQTAGPLKQIFGFLPTLQLATLASERLLELDDSKLETSHAYNRATTGSEPILSMNDHILEFREVSFHYPGFNNRMVCRRVNIKIPRTGRVAIVGESGHGKSTILKLMMRFYEPASGEIIFNRTPFHQMGITECRKHFAAVLQTSSVIDDTVLKNVIMNDDFDEALFQKACFLAGLDEVFKQTNCDRHTMVGTLGVTLSSGQLQRLLLARAFYSSAEVILLDEATNNLDAFNELHIQRSIEELAKTKAIVIVAHRLNTILAADKIFVLKNGQVVQEGTHASLSFPESPYLAMVHSQLVK